MTDLKVMRDFTEKDWYNLFVTIMLETHGEEVDKFHNNVRNAIDDAFAIASVKKRYEENETHKRLW